MLKDDLGSSQKAEPATSVSSVQALHGAPAHKWLVAWVAVWPTSPYKNRGVEPKWAANLYLKSYITSRQCVAFGAVHALCATKIWSTSEKFEPTMQEFASGSGFEKEAETNSVQESCLGAYATACTFEARAMIGASPDNL